MPTSHIDPAHVTVQHNPSARSYDAIVDGEVAGLIVYERTADRLVLTHTIVEPEFRGRGVGTELVRGTLDALLRDGLTVTNFCAFVRDFIDTHPEYEAVIDSEHPGIRNSEVNPEVQERDRAELRRLNAEYIASDQGSDVARYDEFLAQDFTATLPDLVFRDRAQFLEMIARPRPFRDLTAHDVTIRILGDVALVHGRVTYTTIDDGTDREALYTDTYQRRGGRWLCVAANVSALGN